MPRKWKMILIAGGVALLIASLVGVYLLANRESGGDPVESTDEPTSVETESFDALPAPPVEEVVDALNANDKDTLEMYFPEEFRGQDGWTIEDIIGDGTFVLGNTPDPDNAISRSYEAWTQTEDGTTVSEFELVFVYYGDHWLIAKFEAVNAN